MMSISSWIADGFLAVLLSVTIVLGVRLDRALKVVRCDRTAFEALIKNLGAATGSVKLGIQALRDEADRAAEVIGRRSEDADKMATDLSFLIDAAERASGRLEKILQPNPTQAMPIVPPPPAPSPASQELSSASVVTAPADKIRSKPQVGLRELAGITTRRRNRDSDDSPRPRRSATKADDHPPVPVEQSIPPIKLAG